MLLTDLQTFLVETIPHILFLIKKRRSADAHHWTVTLSNWQKQPPEMFHKKNAVRKNFAFFTRTTCETSTQVLGRGWNKVAGRKTSKFIKKRIQHRCFPVNIAKFLLTPVFKDICVWLVLKIIKKDFLEKPPVTMIIKW